MLQGRADGAARHFSEAAEMEDVAKGRDAVQDTEHEVARARYGVNIRQWAFRSRLSATHRQCRHTNTGHASNRTPGSARVDNKPGEERPPPGSESDPEQSNRHHAMGVIAEHCSKERRERKAIY